MQSKVAAEVAKVILIDGDISDNCHMSLLDMGLDSLGTTELAANLQATFDVELPSTIVFNYPTIADLSNYLHDILAPEQDQSAQKEMTLLSARNDSAGLSIVGMSSRFPGGASSSSEYWKLLCEGRETSSNVPFSRWDVYSLAANSKLTEKEKIQIMCGSFVDDMEYFDSSSFGISKAEALSMSPFQRVLLECTYLALCDAGFGKSEMNGLNCGVFVGCTATSSSSPNSSFGSERASVYSATGNAASIASGRISYVFNLQGPNTVYDTACSSSLVALDAAVSALHEGRCEMALVSGVNDLFDRKVFESFARAGMLSPTGRCLTFDASADG